MIHRDVKENSSRHERDNQTRASVGNEGEGDPGQRQEAENGRQALDALQQGHVDLVLADSLKPRLKPIIAREVAYAKG